MIWEEDLSQCKEYLDSLNEQVGDLDAYLREHPEEVEKIRDLVQILDVNSNAVEYYDAESKEDLIRNFEEIFVGEAYAVNRKLWLDVAKGKTEFRHESVSQTLDGETHYEIIDVRVPEEYAEDYSRVYLTVTDITERKQQERNAARFREALDQANDAIFITKVSPREIIDANQTACESLGYGRETLIGMDPAEFELTMSSETEWREHFDTIQEKGSLSYEGRQQRADGSTFPVNVELSSVTLDDEEVIIASARDITEQKEWERQIRRERNRLRALFDRFPEPTVAVSFEGEKSILQEVNPAFERVFGYDAEEVVGTEINDLIVPPEEQELAEKINVRASKHELIDEEVRRITADGERTFIFRNIPVPGDGKLDTYGVYVDITEQKQAQQALREREAHLSQAQSIANLGSWKVDMATGELEWSAEVYNIFGLPQQMDVTFDVFLEQVHPEDRDHVETQWEKAQQGQPYDIEHRIVVNGETRWVREKAVTKDVAETEGQTGIGIVQDITPQKRRELELEDARQKLETIINLVPDLIFAKNRHGEYILANEAVAEAYGRPIEEIVGRTDEELLYSDAEAKQFREDDQSVIESGEPMYIPKEELTKANGETIVVETWKIPFTVSGTDEQAVLGYARDTTEIREHQRQLRILDRMLRHNLNNDLNVIKGFAQLIREADEEEIPRYVETVVDTSEKLLEQVNKEREITKFLADPPTREQIDLTSLVETEVADAEAEYTQAQLTVDCVQECKVTGTTEIARAIRELVDNAVMHSNEAEPTVNVTVRKSETTATIRVEDDGPGIPEIERNVLTGDQEMEPVYHASGMGLWLVRLIVTQAGGTVTYTEKDPRGSVVEITLPRTDT